MSSDREQRITSIFHSAIERDGTERRAFLDGACANDAELRREVESLIDAHEQAGSLLNAPAYERGAGLIESEHGGSLVGRSLGQFRLISLLGAGGMGAVYLAEDTRLGRRAAIKVLPPSFTKNQAQVGRFQQEARVASALNHPNIITVYDINEADGTRYIATEYIEGETLRARIARGAFSLHDALDIAVQIAGALSAAHGAGVVHRDIKPENVMLRPDGYAKVLDFGIAKLTELQSGQSPDAEAPTRALVKTGQGVVMGTAHYMSPEQARGHQVDARTDIWSLGVVLYEMATGRVPFEGETPSDCIASILKTDPPPLTEVAPDAPAQFGWVVQKALRKDADERYQTAKELLSDLRAVRQEVAALAAIERSLPPNATARAGTTTDGNAPPSTLGSVQIDGATADADATSSTPVITRNSSSAEYIVTEIKRHKAGVLIALGAFAVIAAVAALALYKYASREKPLPIFQNVTVSRVTTSGRASDANISPDGRYVVYVEDDDAGNSGILVKQTATGNTLQIVAPAKVALQGTAFSPDSNFVYYLANDLSSDITSLYRVPSIGGETKKVLSDIDGPVAISADGKNFAFVREEQNVKFDLMLANSDGTGERVLTTRQEFEWFRDEGPSWSPDGKTIACAGGSADKVSGEIVEMLLGIDVATGKVRELSPKRWIFTGRVVWMPDGASLALIASEHSTDRPQVWRVSYPAGEASRVTNDVQGRDERSLGITADGRTLVTVTKQTLSRIETLPSTGEISRAARLTTGEANREGMDGFAFVPDGRIVYASSEGSQYDIWIMNGDGSGRRRVTSDAYRDIDPAVSPDGRYIVFASNRASGGAITQIWRMDLDGGNLVKLTNAEDVDPDISPDGRWVIYVSWAPGPQGVVTAQTMWKVSIDGGTPPVQLIDYTVQVPSYSPDGNWIAFITFDDQVTPKRWRNAIIPATGGVKPVKQFDRPNYNYQYLRWTPDGRSLSFIGQPAVPPNIWLQAVAGGEPRKLTDYKTDIIFSHAWSRDGKTLAVVRGAVTTDVVLLTENK